MNTIYEAIFNNYENGNRTDARKALLKLTPTQLMDYLLYAFSLIDNEHEDSSITFVEYVTYMSVLLH